MIRVITILSWACFAGGIVAIAIGSVDAENVGGILIFVSFTIGSVLWVRRMFLGVRSLAKDAKTLFDGDVKEVRVIEVSDPDGFFNARSNVVLEVMDENGEAHGIDREFPIPWPWAIAFRLGRRFNAAPVPDLREELAKRLRRQGVTVSVGPDPGATAAAEPATTQTGT